MGAPISAPKEDPLVDDIEPVNQVDHRYLRTYEATVSREDIPSFKVKPGAALKL